ncbi:hypothetical protein [Rothia koreensis]|uniref:hypothetical protein n=1 Tax=Rothia koreensis TaxID=592378 RepID=UPI003FCE1CDD
MNSSPVDTFPDSPFVWRDLTWPERQPVAKVEPMAGGAPTGEVVRVRVTPNMALGVVLLDETFAESGLWCSGFAHAELDDAGRPPSAPCRAPAQTAWHEVSNALCACTWTGSAPFTGRTRVPS